MRSLGLLLAAIAACGTSEGTVTRTYAFGPFTVQPSQEISDQCVQITLHNDADVYVNAVQLTTGGGFHHSNWDFVPAIDEPAYFGGPDGTFTCADRGFDQQVGALRGGTLFAQSTQSASDRQGFPPGMAIRVPKNSKLVATIHLLNSSDNAITIKPSISLVEIPQKQVTTLMAAMAFEDHALGLPPMMQSSFSVDCDLQPQWNNLLNLGAVTDPTPSFNIHYALAHYHKYGTGLTIEAVKPDNTSTIVYTTNGLNGDALGELMDPPFDFTSYSRIRFTCDYTNTSDQTIVWGLGSQEMCAFLAFTDSSYLWAGGAVNNDPPGNATLVGNVMTYQHVCDLVTAQDSTH